MKNILIITFTILHFLAFGQNSKITIIVKVPDQNDNLYIVSNQNDLGNWKPDKILMKRKSKFERVYEFVPSEFPVEFKFTKGSWEKEAIVEFHQQGNLQINSADKLIYSYNILNFNQDKITNFNEKYRKKYEGKVVVEIPEVFELVNILMALHKDAEKEQNLYDTSTDYYKRVKTYFTPFLNHPIMDTIHRNMGGLRYMKEIDINVFSDESYSFYGNLRANSCNYSFKNHKINHNNYIRYHTINSETEGINQILSLLEDFAKKTNFRRFYKENKVYYESLIQEYCKYNPINKMNYWLEKKFGFGYNSYVVHFSPLTYGFHQTTSFKEDDFNQTFMFVARAMPYKNKSDVMNEIYNSRVVFTEIDHNFVNPISDKFLENINQNFSNRKIWAKEEKSGYNDAYAVFNEYMTWAVYSLYLNDNYTKDEVNEYVPIMEKQMNIRGFNNFKMFNQILLEKYKTDSNIKMTELFEYVLYWSKEQNK